MHIWNACNETQCTKCMNNEKTTAIATMYGNGVRKKASRIFICTARECMWCDHVLYVRKNEL